MYSGSYVLGFLFKMKRKTCSLRILKGLGEFYESLRQCVSIRARKIEILIKLNYETLKLFFS